MGNFNETYEPKSETGTEDDPQTQMVNASRPIQHRFFYLSGKTVVFDVQDVHFKLDCNLFTREVSAFKTMLEISQGGNYEEDKEHPERVIVLKDITPLEFECLIWGLNSYKLHKATVPQDDIERFINIAMVAQKYDMKTLEDWACTGLSTFALGNKDVQIADALQFLHIYKLCKSSDARAAILSTIRQKLMRRICSPAEVVDVIDLGGMFGIPSLVGLAYYTMLMKPRYEWEAEPSFTHCHRMRLLTGSYELSDYSLDAAVKTLGDTFRQHFPELEVPWTEFSTPSMENNRRLARGVKNIDVLGRLRNLLEDFLEETLDLLEDDVLADKIRITTREALESIIGDMVANEFPDLFAGFPE